jgi:hypothetical protein
LPVCPQKQVCSQITTFGSVARISGRVVNGRRFKLHSSSRDLNIFVHLPTPSVCVFVTLWQSSMTITDCTVRRLTVRPVLHFVVSFYELLTCSLPPWNDDVAPVTAGFCDVLICSGSGTNRHRVAGRVNPPVRRAPIAKIDAIFNFARMQMRPRPHAR